MNSDTFVMKAPREYSKKFVGTLREKMLTRERLGNNPERRLFLSVNFQFSAMCPPSNGHQDLDMLGTIIVK